MPLYSELSHTVQYGLGQPPLKAPFSTGFGDDKKSSH